jgi:ornithine cyclodeaminase
MKTRIIGHRDAIELLPMSGCIEVMAGTFRALGRGEAVFPQRQVLWQPDARGAIGLMPSWLGSPPALGAKIASVFPGNTDTPYESHQGAILLFETLHGSLEAIVDAGAITAVRTAAVSGLATRLLAREDAGDLAILGAGTQAAMHLAAMMAVRPVRQVRIWNRNAERARQFVRSMTALHGIPITATATVREAVAAADLVCTVTGATAPILEGAWLAPGVHVNAVGASVPGFRELDTAAVARSRVFVDWKEAALAEADDIRVPIREKVVDEDHVVGDLADLVLDRAKGRAHANDITLFKSVGLAVEDLAAAHHVFEQAAALDAGTPVDFGAERH